LSATTGRLRQVEAALDEDAKAVGSARQAQASAEAARILAAARLESDRIVAGARDEGTVVGAKLVWATRAGARREAREIVFAARDDAYELLRRRVLEELVRRKDTTEASELNDRIERRAIGLLGPGTTIRRDPLGIGLIAEAPARRIDLSPTRLVDACLAELGREVEALWS